MRAILTLSIIFLAVLPYGQSQTLSIDKSEKKQVLDSLSILLTNYYIFPEKIPAAISLLKNNFKKGVYNQYSGI